MIGADDVGSSTVPPASPDEPADEAHRARLLWLAPIVLLVLIAGEELLLGRLGYRYLRYSTGGWLFDGDSVGDQLGYVRYWLTNPDFLVFAVLKIASFLLLGWFVSRIDRNVLISALLLWLLPGNWFLVRLELPWLPNLILPFLIIAGVAALLGRLRHGWPAVLGSGIITVAGVHIATRGGRMGPWWDRPGWPFLAIEALNVAAVILYLFLEMPHAPVRHRSSPVGAGTYPVPGPGHPHRGTVHPHGVGIATAVDGFGRPASPVHAMPPGWQPANNGFAVAALILGIFGFSVLAFIFGSIGLNQIKSSGGTQKGRGMAIAGIVLGAVWTLFVVAIFVSLKMAIDDMSY